MNNANLWRLRAWLTELSEFCLHCTKNSSLRGEMFEQNAIVFLLRKCFKNIKCYTVIHLFTQATLYCLITYFHLFSHYTLRLISVTIPIILEKKLNEEWLYKDCNMKPQRTCAAISAYEWRLHSNCPSLELQSNEEWQSLSILLWEFDYRKKS